MIHVDAQRVDAQGTMTLKSIIPFTMTVADAYNLYQAMKQA